MSLGLIFDPRFCDHDTGGSHPERPDRLRAIIQRLDQGELAGRFERLAFEPCGNTDTLARVHDADYIEHVHERCAAGAPYLDSMDTPVCRASYDIACLAVGGALAAADAVMAGQVQRAFCAVRPPGHHAERSLAMGFCLFNNIAIAAEHLAAAHGIKRIAIVDFDVHHCNGTQHSFEHRADVLVVSSHEHPKFQFPGTGYEHENGVGEGLGATVNAPLLPGTDDAVMREAFESRLLPAIDAFKPQVLLVSAGFDAAAADPLGGLQWSNDAYGWITDRLVEIADRHSDGRIVSFLEGGYSLEALADGVELHLQRLSDDAR